MRRTKNLSHIVRRNIDPFDQQSYIKKDESELIDIRLIAPFIENHFKKMKESDDIERINIMHKMKVQEAK